MAKGKNAAQTKNDAAKVAGKMTSRKHALEAPPLLKRESGRGDTIRVRPDSMLADLIPGFLKNRRHDVVSMLDALARGDFKTVGTLGHGMRGAGGGYGFMGITDIGAALEQAAESADLAASHKWVAELTSYLDRVVVLSD